MQHQQNAQDETTEIKYSKYKKEALPGRIPYLPLYDKVVGRKDYPFEPIHLTGHPNLFNLDEDHLMGPALHELDKISNNYNHNDVRLFIKDLPYFKTGYGDGVFTGTVAGYRYTYKKNNLRLYVLVRSVSALLHDADSTANQARPKLITDHFWVDVNDFILDNELAQLDSLDIGIGDELVFGANIKKYYGYRNNIKQLKYGIKDARIITCGYPLLESTNHGTVDYHPFTPILYNHHNQKLFTIYNREKYPIAYPELGSQIERKLHYIAKKSTNTVGNLPNLNLHGQIMYAFNNKTTKHEMNGGYKLILETSDNDFAHKHPIHWSNETYHVDNNQIQLLKLSEILPNTSFYSMYKRSLNLTKYRKTVK